MGETASDQLELMQDQMTRMGEDMRRFKESVYAAMIDQVAINIEPMVETLKAYQYWEDTPNLVPDSAVELVDEMF